jgi:hypothetical protein
MGKRSASQARTADGIRHVLAGNRSLDFCKTVKGWHRSGAPGPPEDLAKPYLKQDLRRNVFRIKAGAQ